MNWLRKVLMVGLLSVPSLAAPIIYENGSANPGTFTSNSISGGFSISNTFTVTAADVATSVVFDARTPLNQPLVDSVSWSISSDPDGGGTVWGSGTATVIPGTVTSAVIANVYLASFALPNVALDPGSCRRKVQGRLAECSL